MAYVCWRTDDLDTVLSLEALSGKEELFLATHFPVEQLYIKKSGGEFRDRYCDQDALYAALVRERVHMFCVIEGIAGCGKSHLIRWLAVQWRRKGPKNDVVLLLPRSGRNPGRMVGVLRDELRNLGYEGLSNQLTTGDDLTPAGRRESFLDRLAILLDSRNVQQKRSQWEWCDQKRIADVVRAVKVREQWHAPARLIEDHEKEALPIFHREEVWQLVKLAMSGSSLRPGTIVALERIKAESEQQDHCPETDRLLSALNDRSRPALRAALGLNERIISEVFTELRRRLHGKGKRLVILQEDITAAQGIDETLLDLFVSQAGMEGVQECPLVAVCGITPAYEEKYFNQTYGNRVTLHVDMSRSGESREIALSVVGTPDHRWRFVARYLNGIRWSAAELREHWDERDAPPSRCVSCEYQSKCHRTFGAEDGYGLYPFTRSAIERGYEHLTDRDDPSLGQTPRNVLLGLLRPSLMLKTQVEQNRFPSPEVQTDRMKDSILDLAPDVDEHIRKAPPEQYERLRALIGLWGDGGATQAGVIDGEPSFGGVSKSVYEWFTLPWLGDGIGPLAKKAPGESAPPPPPKTVAGPSTERDKRLAELDKHLAELKSWREDSVIQSQSWWEDQIWQIVTKIPWADHGIPEWSGKQLLTRERVKLEGSKGGDDFLVVPFKPWATVGLQALVHLKYLPGEDVIRYGANYLAFVERVTEMARSLVRQRMAAWRSQNHKPWDPFRTAIECLTIHAWVCGRVVPSDSLDQHWRTILSFPQKPQSVPAGREEGWHQLCEGNIGPLQTVSRFLDNWLALRQGSTGKVVLENAADAVEILRSFVELLEMSGLPRDNFIGSQDLSAIAEAAKFTNIRWTGLLAKENERLREQVSFIEGHLGKSTLRETAAAVHAALDQASAILTSVAAHEVNEWAKAYGQLSLQAWWNDKTFEKALDEWPGANDEHASDMLERCMKAPAERFDAVMRMLAYGDSALTALEDRVKALLGGSAADPATVLKEIRTEGEKIHKQVKSFRQAVKKHDDSST